MENIPKLSEKIVYKTNILKKEYLTKNVIMVRVEKPKDFSYTAGQFVQWHVPDTEKTVLRSYSISSTPADSYIEFCIKVLPDGKASTMLVSKNVGDEISFSQARGRFTMGENRDNLFFIATGVGLAPIMGILRDELKNKSSKKDIKLLFGVHSEEDIFWKEELEQLVKNHSNFSFYLTISKPVEEDKVKNIGRVTNHMTTLPTGYKYFMCGSPEMIKECRSIIVSSGILSQDIHFEIF